MNRSSCLLPVLLAACALLASTPSVLGRALTSSTIIKSQAGLLTQKPAPLCAAMGSIKFHGASLATCLQFHTGPIAIKAPADTATTKYGAVKLFMDGTFVDRKGRELPFSTSLLPKYMRDGYTSGTQSMSQMLFKATLNAKGKITAMQLQLLIDQTTMAKPFAGSSFVGTVINAEPGDGVNETAWFRWDLSSNFSYYERSEGEARSAVMALDATFTNLYSGVVSSASESGNATICRPPLLAGPNATEWYEHAVGNGTDIRFYWYSDMHGPLDSEFVPVFSNHVSYMASVPNPAMLLATNVDTTKEYRFIVHGTPMNVLQSFVGTFQKLGPAVEC